MGSLPPDCSLDQVKIKIRETYKNPSIGKIAQVVLKEGPRTFRIVTLMEVLDPKSKEFHHYSMKIDHIDKKKAGWFSEPQRSVRIDGNEPDEIQKLYEFLHAVFEGKIINDVGDLRIIKSSDYAQLEQFLNVLPNLANTDKFNVVKTILSELDESEFCIEEFVKTFEQSESGLVANIALASRLVDYKSAFQVLKEMVNNEQVSEREIQKHLDKNPWMFGSEYSELIPKKVWTRDDKLDYMLRRTTDNYLEIIEIKTPFRDPLFIFDRSHDCYYQSSKLSSVIGQIMRYIEEVERNRDSIIANDGFETLKIRARAIIGRDGDEGHQKTLRNLNSHLHRVEIVTFDQLLRIASRVLSVFESFETESKDNLEDESEDLSF